MHALVATLGGHTYASLCGRVCPPAVIRPKIQLLVHQDLATCQQTVPHPLVPFYKSALRKHSAICINRQCLALPATVRLLLMQHEKSWPEWGNWAPGVSESWGWLTLVLGLQCLCSLPSVVVVLMC